MPKTTTARVGTSTSPTEHAGGAYLLLRGNPGSMLAAVHGSITHTNGRHLLSAIGIGQETITGDSYPMSGRRWDKDGEARSPRQRRGTLDRKIPGP